MRGLALAIVVGSVTFCAVCAGCGTSGPGSSFVPTGVDGSTGGPDGTTGPGRDASMSFGEGGGGDGGGGCDPPDMLIVLDHTDSMSATPAGTKPPNTPAGHATTKWVLATTAVKAVTAPPNDQGLRFGLELFPLDPQTVDAGPGQGACVTLSQLLSGQASTNAACKPAEVLTMPALGTGTAISGLLDPETVRLCVTTPIASALDTATTTLASIATPSRKQLVLLVTDGGETCKGDVVGVTQQLAAKGIKTYVVGFGTTNGGAGGVNVKLLNNVACAGMTATGFPAPCSSDAGGYVATNPNGPPVFFSAQDGASLSSALKSITAGVCCGCAK